MRKGFTLVEMLVVIGIISILMGVGIGTYSSVTKTAEKAKCQELVSNVATALTALYQQEGAWPRRIAAQGAADGRLDASTAFALAANGRKYLSLTKNSAGTALAGLDRFGIVSPWATAVIKRKGADASLGTVVSIGKDGAKTIEDHILHFAVDLDGDGIIQGASVGGESVDVRATAIVWSAGKDGRMESYTKGQRRDDVYSWTPGMTKNVK